MKRIAVIAIILLSISLLAACVPATQSPSPSPTISLAPSGTAAVQTITPAEAKRRLDTEQGIILLDVRTAAEYAAGHIAGSVLIPVDRIAAEAGAILTDKNAVLFVYCRSGRRSAIAASELVTMGYAQVFDLGGINSWPYGVVAN
jgi:phage shock protein E